MVPPPPRSTLFPYTTLFRSDEFVAKLDAALRAAPIGDPAQDVLYGPMLHERFAERFEDWLGLIRDHRSEEHTSELQSRLHLVCRLLLEKKKKIDVFMARACM